jgi:enterochelin esterase family protein
VGRANFIMDNLLAENKTKPALIVMPFGHPSRDIMSGFRPRGAGGPPPGGGPSATGGPPVAGGPPAGGPPAGGARPTGGIFGDSILETDLKDNVIPMVESEFRVGKDRDHRAIAGLSMGGHQALTIGLENPQLFAYVAGMSSALVGGRFENDVQSFMATPEKANKDLKLLWLGCGTSDGLLAPNQAFEQALTDKGIHHEWHPTPGYAHWWTLWRLNLRDLLPELFNN